MLPRYHAFTVPYPTTTTTSSHHTTVPLPPPLPPPPSVHHHHHHHRLQALKAAVRLREAAAKRAAAAAVRRLQREAEVNSIYNNSEWILLLLCRVPPVIPPCTVHSTPCTMYVPYSPVPHTCLTYTPRSTHTAHTTTPRTPCTLPDTNQPTPHPKKPPQKRQPAHVANVRRAGLDCLVVGYRGPDPDLCVFFFHGYVEM